MSDPADQQTPPPAPAPPKLPEVDTPPAAEVIDGVPSPEALLAELPSVADIVGHDDDAPPGGKSQ
jgi:hypothetical protein